MVLSPLVTEQVLPDETLATAFAKAEGTLQERPMVPIHFDIQGDMVLNAIRLLLSLDIPSDHRLTEIYRRKKHVKYLTFEFWRRWIRDYLQLLQLR